MGRYFKKYNHRNYELTKCFRGTKWACQNSEFRLSGTNKEVNRLFLPKKDRRMILISPNIQFC